MTKIYAIEKETNLLKYISDNLATLKGKIKNTGKTEEDFYILEDLDMKYISRISFVDGVCVYNNKNYWINDAKTILEDFDTHSVLDFLGKPVDFARFTTEMNSNITRIAAIDGIAGEVEYNITVGNEFISLFREECVKTDFKTITPLQIAQKLSSVIGLVQTGSFREAKQVLQTIENDDFLTPERVSKYIAMMESADAIEYATEEDFFYTASNNT